MKTRILDRFYPLLRDLSPDSRRYHAGRLDPFMFQVGEAYETQEGRMVTVIARHGHDRPDLRGYETVLGDDGFHRYDRSTHWLDSGRVTASAPDYSCPQNFKRPLNLRAGTLTFARWCLRLKRLQGETGWHIWSFRHPLDGRRIHTLRKTRRAMGKP